MLMPRGRAGLSLSMARAEVPPDFTRGTFFYFFFFYYYCRRAAGLLALMMAFGRYSLLAFPTT